MKERQYRWFLGFDDDETYKRVALSLQNLGLSADKQYLECPDGVHRLLVDVRYELIPQLRTVRFGGKPFKILRRVLPEGKLESWPPGKPKPKKPGIKKIKKALAEKIQNDPPPF